MPCLLVRPLPKTVELKAFGFKISTIVLLAFSSSLSTLSLAKAAPVVLYMLLPTALLALTLIFLLPVSSWLEFIIFPSWEATLLTISDMPFIPLCIEVLSLELRFIFSLSGPSPFIDLSTAAAMAFSPLKGPFMLARRSPSFLKRLRRAFGSRGAAL